MLAIITTAPYVKTPSSQRSPKLPVVIDIDSLKVKKEIKKITADIEKPNAIHLQKRTVLKQRFFNPIL